MAQLQSHLPSLTLLLLALLPLLPLLLLQPQMLHWLMNQLQAQVRSK